ncbi:hypothetical protein [Gluconobacter oxydans]|uniref:hypothetical protein n=1 Tax=Gluconobacter oxydans TaxID=442 RepID=UPI0026471D59|nr:hypothetical protein [Gluconobacter oxydans]WKE49651.1 hypothetical protein NUJ38_13850 [Gluconobacter oxydans]
MSTERQEPPDIDVDFESDRREEVPVDLPTLRPPRAALCAPPCSAISPKARCGSRQGSGLPEDLTGQLSKHIASSADPICAKRARPILA